MKSWTNFVDEEKCELMNEYLNNTIFIKPEEYGRNYISYITEATNFICINVYSSLKTPIQFPFPEDSKVSVNVYVKGVPMDSLLLDEDKFSYIQENSRRMLRKIMKNYYHADILII